MQTTDPEQEIKDREAATRWAGPDTDIRNRKPPTPEELDAIRRNAQGRPAQGRPAQGPDMVALAMGGSSEAHTLAYHVGSNSSVSVEFFRRFIRLQADLFLVQADLEATKRRLDQLENKAPRGRVEHR